MTPEQRDALIRLSHHDRAQIIRTQQEFEQAMAEVEATIAYALWETDIPPYRPSVTFVHPRVYAKRAECPDWTNAANPAHVHDADCSAASRIDP